MVGINIPPKTRKQNKEPYKPKKRKEKKVSYKKGNQHFPMVNELINSKNWDLELACATPSAHVLGKPVYVFN